MSGSRLAVAGGLLIQVSGLCAQTTQPAGYARGAVAVCELQDDRIREASGLAASRRHPGCYYVHNDSGDEPRVFLIDRGGRTRRTIRLRNAAAVDFEDIALAPGATPATFDVCVADIGDNSAKRPHVVIYRFPEPDLGAADQRTIEVEPVAYRVRYTDGPADAEAFCVHPGTGDGYILTKRVDGGSVVYKLAAPWNVTGETCLPRVGTLALPPALPPARIVTAADIAPDGRRLAVRCCVDGWEWRLPGGGSAGELDRIFQAEPALLSLAAEPQGEALGYAADGRAILTVSEGRSPTLYELRVLDTASRPAR